MERKPYPNNLTDAQCVSLQVKTGHSFAGQIRPLGLRVFGYLLVGFADLFGGPGVRVWPVLDSSVTSTSRLPWKPLFISYRSAERTSARGCSQGRPRR